MWRIGPIETEKYNNIVASFLADNEKFNNFKRQPFYTSVIGAPDAIQMIALVHEATNDLFIKEHLDALLEYDKFANPIIYDFPKMQISANLLRDIDTLRCIKNKFGDLDKLNIVEYGVGMCGLMYCINKLFNVKSYNIIDLPLVVTLAKKIANVHGIQINEYTANDEIDLFVASYSLTEQDIDTVHQHTKNILFKAKRAFIRSNFMRKEDRNKWLDLVKTKFEVVREREAGNTLACNEIFYLASK